MTTTPTIRVPLAGMDAYLSIFGANGRNLSLLEGELGVTLAVRGSDLEISGGEEDAALAARVVDKLTDLSARGAQIDRTTLRYAAKLARQDELDRLDDIAFEVVAITHRGRPVRCKTLGQYDYVRAIRGHELTFAVARRHGRRIWPWRWPWWRCATRRSSASCSRAPRWRRARGWAFCRAI